MKMANTTQVILFASSLTLLSLVLYNYWKKTKKQLVPPTTWKPIAKVKQLFIYPLKSGHPIELQSAVCTQFGVKVPAENNNMQFSDRSFIVYKDDFVFITGRQHPKLIFIKISVVDDKCFALNAPDMLEIIVQLPKRPKKEALQQVMIHKGEKINTIDCGDEVAKWISKYILDKNNGLRLGFYDEGFRRNISKGFKNYFPFYPFLSNKATGMYSDLSSYHLINQASINELRNSIPESNVTSRNFRPNIVVEGTNLKSFEEDNWTWIKIGDVVLYVARYCTRCIFTTINPETGVISSCNEPLRTMRNYRKLKDISNVTVDGELAVMGLNLGLEAEGVINIGDVVYIGSN